jgi:exodeoxyribonuclease V alpha subunit
MVTVKMTDAALMNKLQALVSHNVIREIDYQFARFSAQHTSETSEPGLLALLCASLSYELGQGNTCLDLTEFCHRTTVFEGSEISPPAHDNLINHLGKESFVGSPGHSTPLILDGEKLYFQRYYQCEQEIADRIRIAAQQKHDVDPDSASKILNRYFGELPESKDQKLAAALALTRSLVVISGGPGTGKTTTAVRILALLVEVLSSPEHSPLIRLAAPTGKAAMRLSTSIRHALEQLPCDDAIKAAIPVQATTIHRLLGIRSVTGKSRFDRNNLLSADILIVDEVSMIDIQLMAKLLESLPPACRIILIGDQNQLPSVEAGNVLADLYRLKQDLQVNSYSKDYAGLLSDLVGSPINSENTATSITDCLCELEQTFRFSPQSGIARLAQAVHEGNLLDESSQSIESESAGLEIHSTLDPEGNTNLAGNFKPYFDLVADDAVSTQDKINRFDCCRVLTPLRQGPVSTAGLNSIIEQQLSEMNLISTRQDYYIGRPVLINRNDYNLGLFNGDIGICVDDPIDGLRKVAFLYPDGTEKKLLPARLPPHETCYAMTIHKSQGSEFDHVLIVLPDDPTLAKMDLLNRELLYTAITRARKSLALFASQDQLVDIVSRRYIRRSGLTQKLSKSEMG